MSSWPPSSFNIWLENTRSVKRLKNKWLKSTCKKADENILYFSPFLIELILNLYLLKKERSLKPLIEIKTVNAIIKYNIIQKYDKFASMNYLTKFIISPLLIFISYLPFRVLYFVSDIFYYLLYYIIRYRRKIVRKNLILSNVSKNYEDLLRIEKEFYRHLTDVFFEMFKFYSISPDEMKKRFYIENPEIFFELILPDASKTTFFLNFNSVNFFIVLLICSGVKLSKYSNVEVSDSI